MQPFIAPFFLLICLCLFNLSCLAEEQSLEQLNDSVSFLVGLDLPNSGFQELAESKSYRYNKAKLDKEWRKYTERTLAPMGEWARREVAPHSKPGGVVRYMFSGPDILHALTMFPGAGTFVLCGLEPVGVVPDIRSLSPGSAGHAFSEVRNALGEVINFSFFRTKDMKSDLRYSTFRGTTPLMMGFLARSGQYVKGYEFFKLQKDGSLESRGTESKGVNVVKMTFSPKDARKSKTLYYFSTDLSDGHFAKSGFEKWLTSQPKGDAYLKAASFLLHRSSFDDVRKHLIDYSTQILEDDSGIPYRYFDKEKWDCYLYGSYSGPIDLFSQYNQSDLRAAYRKAKIPMEFGTGYKWRKGESNIMRFVLKGTRKKAVGATQPKFKSKTPVLIARPVLEDG